MSRKIYEVESITTKRCFVLADDEEEAVETFEGVHIDPVTEGPYTQEVEKEDMSLLDPEELDSRLIGTNSTVREYLINKKE